MNKNYFTSVTPIKEFETFCFLLVTFFSINIYSQDNRIGLVTDNLTVSDIGPFKVAAGVTSLDIKCWGAGGGGGGSNFLSAGGGGGGGGAFRAGTIFVSSIPSISANPEYAYSVGKGGTGGSSTAMHGLDGSPSSFSSIIANGGTGGKGATSSGNYGAGGIGGIGDYKGGDGAKALSIVIVGLVSGGGGGGAGSDGSGSNGNNSALNQAGGIGGNGSGGSGGSGNLLAGSGGNASSVGFGGGGGGGLTLLSLFNSTGGNGGNGQIKVNYTCPIYSITGFSTNVNCAQTSNIALTGNLPKGTYEISYNISSGLEVTVPMVVTTAGTGSITVAGIPIVGSNTVTITKIKSEGCWTKVNFPILFDRPAKPIVGTITHPTCAEPKGKVILSGLVIGGTIRQTGVANASYSVTATTETITGLDAGTYNFVVYNGVCSSQTVSAVSTLNINYPPPTKTWNGSWVDGRPTIENKVIFAANYNQTLPLDDNLDVEACSCEVKSGANVTFKIGRYLKLRNELVVSSGGSLTFENNASLIQTNDAAPANSGNINYHRHTAPVRRYDFTYWSSPVVRQTLYDLSPNTLGDKYYRYDPEAGWQISYNGTDSMEKGKGYIIRAPQYFDIDVAAVDYNPVFIGTPNNGVITLPSLAVNRVHLLGNPYPSAIDADAFLKKNEGKLEGTLYFWTHNSPPSSTVGTFPGNTAASYNYAASDYAIYNKTGGVGTPAVIEGAVSNGGARLTGKIAAGQGFFAPASATGGEIVFNNSMRLSGNTVIDNSQFFKLNDVSKSNAADATTTIEKNRIWLNLTNEEGAFKQTLIGYITGATNDYEGSFDGVSYDGNQYVDFYSINQELNLSIQGRALPFQQKDSVVLGYKTTIAGNFKINIDHVDGSMVSQKVFLEDKTTQVLHDLKEPYTFTTEKGIFNNRFVLRYEDKNAVIEDIVDVAVEGVLISSKNKIITIDTTDEIIKTIYVYDFSGRLVYSDTDVNETATSISNLSNAAQALIVKVELENGKKSVKKIIY